ncbi:MAG: GAF domain-containing protein [candidate division KSB1 bacterium]|nr:GAF domain-containing protein [candidate division KSB1 bacterium]
MAQTPNAEKHTDFLDEAQHQGLDAFLDAVLEEGLRAVGAFQGSLMLLNEKEKTLEIVKRRGPEYDPKRKHRRFRIEEGVAGMVAATGEPYLCGDVTEDQRFKPPVGKLNFRSLVVVPIKSGARTVGVICADSPEPHRFTEEHTSLLAERAASVGNVIERLAVDTFIVSAKRMKQLESLHEVAQELSKITFQSPQELSKLLNEIARDAERVLEADLVTLYQYFQEEESFDYPPILSGRFQHPEWMCARLFREDAPYRIVAAGEPRYCENASQDRVMRARETVPAGDGLPERPSFVDREGVVSSAGIPLIAGTETVGVLFINYRAYHQFTPEEKRVIEMFAAYAALAIQGTRWIQQLVRMRQLEALRTTSRMFAHRLRNILPIITDRIDRIATKGGLNEEGKEWCEMAWQEAQRAQRVVSDFESFSRAELRQPSSKLSIGELVKKLGEVAKRNLTQIGASIEVVDAEPNLPSVIVDLDRLSDDFANFVQDSQRHRPSGLQVRISAALASEADALQAGLPKGGRYVKLIYEDNGPGIDLPNKRRIFEPFYTTTGGTGLGLAIVEQDARAHGGTILECGQPGRGVRFELYLPIAGQN